MIGFKTFINEQAIYINPNELDDPLFKYDIVFYKSPGHREIDACLKKSLFSRARFLVDESGSIRIWPAELATHDDIENYSGVAISDKLQGYITYRKNQFVIFFTHDNISNEICSKLENNQKFQFMMKRKSFVFLRDLHEKFERLQGKKYGPLDAYYNPSNREMKVVISKSKYKELRFLIINQPDKLYIWDADLYTHADMKDLLSEIDEVKFEDTINTGYIQYSKVGDVEFIVPNVDNKTTLSKCKSFERMMKGSTYKIKDFF